ncbi:hypothetical protein [uncultured Roseivirga sp.]|uniref:hypothetical protein n=1 Tax=uncultured Roseivirga sp. TaxID=543088 RepID=UPI0030DDA8AD|tara:strand:- start:2226 stop:2447 length:222 start_codon:yes stop_codon:yes gene_type:complete
MKKISFLIPILCLGFYSIAFNNPSVCIASADCGNGEEVNCNATEEYSFCEAQAFLRACCNGICHYCEGPLLSY